MLKKAKLKSSAALGEIPVEILSDAGSTPAISTTNRLGMLTPSRLFYCNGKRMISMVAAFFET